MTKKLLKIVLGFAVFIGVLFAFFFFGGVRPANAAVLQLFPDKGTAAIGDTVQVDVRIDSEGVSVNAAEAVIQFPNNILEVTSVSKTSSLFNFWLKEPVFSNGNGTISFIGGSSAGFSGASLQILRVTFKVKGAGESKVDFSDGAVAASDGSGTNVLREMRGVTIKILSSAQVGPGITPSPVAPPTQIIRPAVPTGVLPTTPQVAVPLYPDPNGWYNLKSKFSATWQLPIDITGVDTLLNAISNSNPSVSEGLFENREFAPLEDGVWYLHVRFKNNIGWGQTAHYRIAIDTTPPVPFVLTSDVPEKTDNPSPLLSYKSGDNLSGLKHYAIRVLGREVEYTTRETHKISPLSPGVYTISVAAVDNAGNSTEKMISVEILPIDSPVITFVSEKVVLDENSISIAGTTVPNGKVKLILRSERGDAVAEKEVLVDSLGNWSGEFSDTSIRSGIYTISAQVIDSRGAQSLFVESPLITVKDKPLFTIAGVDITTTWFFVGLIILLLIGFVIGYIYERLETKQRSRKILIAQRDVHVIFNLLKKDVDTLVRVHSKAVLDETDIAEVRHSIRNINDTLVKMRKYLSENIGEIEE